MEEYTIEEFKNIIDELEKIRKGLKDEIDNFQSQLVNVENILCTLQSEIAQREMYSYNILYLCKTGKLHPSLQKNLYPRIDY